MIMNSQLCYTTITRRKFKYINIVEYNIILVGNTFGRTIGNITLKTKQKIFRNNTVEEKQNTNTNTHILHIKNKYNETE